MLKSSSTCLLLDVTTAVKKPSSPTKTTSSRLVPTDLDPYNISNDHHYEGIKHRVRQTFGSIIVQHSYPALKLQLPYVSRLFPPWFPSIDLFKSVPVLTPLYLTVQYKTYISKSDARSWHRPALQFPSNIKLTFNHVKSAKTIKDEVGRKLGKGGDIAEGLRKPGDLTLKDTSSFVLWEFSVSAFPSDPFLVCTQLCLCLLCCRKNTPRSCLASGWEVYLSTIIAKRTITTNLSQG